MPGNEFTFPFDTCETPKKGAMVAQPWSTFFNIVSFIIVFYFLLQAKSLHAFLIILGVAIFDANHIFSHFMHIQKGFQVTLVHLSAYFINFSLLYGLYNFSHKKLTNFFIGLIGFIIALDIYAFFNMAFLWYLITQVIFFLVILYYYRDSIIKIMGYTRAIGLLFLTSIIYMAFVNEAVNCKTMLQWWPSFPFHAVVEVIILLANYLFVSSFYKI
jgi:hypothetical protein